MRVAGLAVSDVANGQAPVVLDVKAQNTGGEQVLITRALLTVREFAYLEICHLATEIKTSGNDDISVPVEMTPGQTLNIALNLRLAGDEMDRIQLALQHPPRAYVAGVSLYRFRLILETDGDEGIIDGGDVLVALPFTPNNNDYPWYWGSRFVAQPPDWLGSYRAATEECLHKNSALLTDFLARPGVRSDQLAAVTPDLR